MSRWWFALALAAPSLAWASPCDVAADGMAIGPVWAPARDGGIASPRRTCVRSEFGAAITGRATVELDDFYGYLVGGLDLDFGWAIDERFEFFGRLETVRFDLAIASVQASNLGLGHLILGGAFAQPVSDEVAVGARVRVMLPTATGLYANARPLGLDVAVSSVWTPLPWLRVHDELGGLVLFQLGRDASAIRGGAWANLGLELLVQRNFGLVFDVDGAFGTRAAVDYLDVGAGLRFSDGKRFGFEIGGRVPVAGAALELARVGLRASVRFGPVADGARAIAREAPRMAPDARLATL